jgi:hypothetical protein
MLRTAPSTPKKMAHAIDVKSSTMTENSMPRGPKANRKLITIGKYPRIGIDCSRSIRGVRISEAVLFVAAIMPKDTPQAIEIKSVIIIRVTVLKVYKGRSLISGYCAKLFMISQIAAQRIANPPMKLIKYFRKLHASAYPTQNH